MFFEPSFRTQYSIVPFPTVYWANFRHSLNRLDSWGVCSTGKKRRYTQSVSITKCTHLFISVMILMSSLLWLTVKFLNPIVLCTVREWKYAASGQPTPPPPKKRGWNLELAKYFMKTRLWKLVCVYTESSIGVTTSVDARHKPCGKSYTWEKKKGKKKHYWT